MTSTFKTVAITTALLCQASVLSAAPLPDGTTLLLESGANSDVNTPCLTGSCFGMEVSPGFWIWMNLTAGTDSGFVVGKNQSCGGQEIAPSATINTPGELTAAWFFLSGYGTLCANNALNTFSETSNDGATTINDFTMAWNGTVIPLGGGSDNVYIIDLDGMGGGNWRMEYTSVITTGEFTGVNFWLIAEGSVVPVDTFNNPPVVNDINLSVDSGVIVNWSPNFTDDPGDTHTCTITKNLLYGNATVNADCTGGTTMSGSGYFGLDSFQYTVTDQGGFSATGTVNVDVSGCSIIVACSPLPTCQDDYPLRQVTTVGGGQSQNVNATVTTTFIGHIMTEAGLTTGAKNSVKICPGTTLDFETTATTGTASCIINSAVTASMGRLAAGDKLICTNKPDGGDVDRYSIKSGSW